MSEDPNDAVKDDAVKDDAAADDAVKDDAVKDDKVVDPEKDVPVKYELAMPKDSLLEPSVIDEIVSYAKDQGLSNEAAQKILDRESGAVAKHMEAKEKEFEEIRKDWEGKVKADKELGGENLERSAEISQRVVDRFGSKEFKTLLEDTGWGNNPEVIRIFKRIGETMTDDQFVKATTKTTGADRSDADVLFGDSSTA